MSYKQLNQRDSRWKNIKLGYGTGTIGDFGCTLTILAMMAGVTPDKLNSMLKGSSLKNSAFAGASKNLINWTKLEKYTDGLLKFHWRGYGYDSAKIKDTINKYGACLVEVYFDGTGRSDDKHWILSLGDQKANDPWVGREIPTSNYSKWTGWAEIEVVKTINDTDVMPIKKVDFEKLVTNSGKWDETVKYLEVPSDPATTPFDKVRSVIAGIRSRLTDLGKQVTTSIAELKNRTEQVSRLKAQLRDEASVQKDQYDKLNLMLKTSESQRDSLEGRIGALQRQVDAVSIAKGQLNKDKAKVEAELKECQDKYKILVSEHTAELTFWERLKVLIKGKLL